MVGSTGTCCLIVGHVDVCVDSVCTELFVNLVVLLMRQHLLLAVTGTNSALAQSQMHDCKNSVVCQ